MFDWLIRIPGPQFLLIFPLFVAAITLVVRRIDQFSKTKFDEISRESPNLNPLELALLSGGESRTAELALFELYREGSISFTKESKIARGLPPPLHTTISAST